MYVPDLLLHVLEDQDGSACNPRLKGKLVQALTTEEFSPLFEKARADQNFGYTFFEYAAEFTFYG